MDINIVQIITEAGIGIFSIAALVFLFVKFQEFTKGHAKAHREERDEWRETINTLIKKKS